MADNIDKEHLENFLDPQSENPPNEIIPAKDIEPISANQEIENMEVHHHPDLHHRPKKWKEYFIEFLMIFLAVVMGFFAESYREHLTDQTKEKEYIESLIEDLKSDQQVLGQHILDVKKTAVMMDTVIAILNTPSQISNNTAQLYYCARLGPRLKPLSNNSRTFEQLKNSGNFRLIKNINISNKIMSYYEKFTLTHLLESISQDEFNDYKRVAAKIFDPAVFIKMEGENSEIKKTNDKPLLRTINNDLLQELSVFSVYLNSSKKTILDGDKEIKIAGTQLIEFLKKEYNLE